MRNILTSKQGNVKLLSSEVSGIHILQINSQEGTEQMYLTDDEFNELKEFISSVNISDETSN